MKKTFFLIAALFCLIGLAGFTNKALGLETTGTSSASLLNRYTFPVPELGNCANVTTCSAFCSQTQNHDACYQYALTHKLYPPQATASITADKYLTDAKSFLGCDGYIACKTYCSDSVNKTKCSEFSQVESRLYPTTTNTTTTTKTFSSLTTLLFQATKSELGCDSESSCGTFCANTANVTKCAGFVYRHLLISAGGTTTPPQPLKISPPTSTGSGTINGTKPTTF